MAEPWERQPGESRQAFEAFTRYRDMPGRRSHAKVAEALGKSEQLMAGWSSRWRWVDRVAAWDAEEDRIFREEVARQRIAVARKQAAVAALMLQKATTRLQSIDADKLTATELERWMRTATDIERQALVLDEQTADTIKQAAGAVTQLVAQLRAGK